MKITVNGKQKELPEKITLRELVCRSLAGPRHVIAEVNGQVVTTARWDQTGLADGDQVELVTIVGGG